MHEITCVHAKSTEAWDVSALGQLFEHTVAMTSLGKLTSAVRDTGVSRHNGGPTLKPLNTIVL